MEVPQVDGLQAGKLIGSGGCGRVYRATDDAGTLLAVKVFDDAAVSRRLLEKMTKRLEVGGWPAGVLPVISATFTDQRSFWVMPLLASVTGDAEIAPSSLQMSINTHPGEGSWTLVRSLARALAGMHERRVAHGNLKPGNLFFGADGELLLSDWALGNMPGVKHVNFTDALLYQPPEQLKNSGAYLEEAGYRWDVFSFGALAYRILRRPRKSDHSMAKLSYGGEMQRIDRRSWMLVQG